MTFIVMIFFSALALAAQDDDTLVIYSKDPPSDSGPIVTSSPAPVLSKSYPWFENSTGYKKAVEEQKITGEAFVIYFYATWCHYCKQFTRDILWSSRGTSALRSVVKVKIDGDQESRLMKKFGITGYPTFLVVKASGKSQRIDTDVSVTDFLYECKRAGLKINAT